MNSFKQKIQEEFLQILFQSKVSGKEVLNETEIMQLPAPVKKWLKVSGAVGKLKADTVSLKQTFRMKLKPNQKKWYHATARQFFTTQNPAFIWVVKLKMAPFISILGRDKFFEAKGEIQMTLNGLFNLGKEKGSKINEGTLQRYLGEIVWFPSAALSPHIKWEEKDAFSAKATLNYQGTVGSGMFYFNKDGMFEKYIAFRYMENSPEAKRYEWIITTLNHSEWNGIFVPSKLEATWILETGKWTWCRIEINQIQYNADENFELL